MKKVRIDSSTGAPVTRKPRRQALPEHLEHRPEPTDTTCPSTECGRPTQRIGEDVSEWNTS